MTISVESYRLPSASELPRGRLSWSAEPECAVRAAVESGALPAERLASFHKLSDERATGAHKQDAARRLAEPRKAKARRYAPRPGKPDDER